MPGHFFFFFPPPSFYFPPDFFAGFSRALRTRVEGTESGDPPCPRRSRTLDIASFLLLFFFFSSSLPLFSPAHVCGHAVSERAMSDRDSDTPEKVRGLFLSFFSSFLSPLLLLPFPFPDHSIHEPTRCQVSFKERVRLPLPPFSPFSSFQISLGLGPS